MAQILLLLTMAMNLLVAAQAPNVPQSLRDTAVKVANYAIQVANKTLAEATTTTPVVSAPTPEPVLGSLPQPTPAFVPVPQPPQPAPQIVYVPAPQPEVKKELKIDIEGENHNADGWYYPISVHYYRNKTLVNDIPVTLTSSDGFFSVTSTTTMGGYGEQPNVTFFYQPNFPPSKTLTATADGVSSTVTFDRIRQDAR